MFYVICSFTPHNKKERNILHLAFNHPALLIINAFRGQMTDLVIQKLRKNNIRFVRVPASITNLFQPLDLIINGSAKAYMKRRFRKWHNSSITNQLGEGKSVENIDVELKLSSLNLFTQNGLKISIIIWCKKKVAKNIKWLEGSIRHRNH